MTALDSLGAAPQRDGPLTSPEAVAPAPAAVSLRAQWAEEQPISDLMHRALVNPALISLAAGFVDQESLPVDAVRQAVDRLLSSGAALQSLQYGTTQGHAPLREMLLARTLAADGMSAAESNLTVDQVVVTAGSNQLLHLVADTLLNPGDLVLCPSPTYFVFLGAVHALGARSYGVAADDEGLDPIALEAALARLASQGELPRVKAIYFTPDFDNPRGAVTSLARRMEIVRLAKVWSKRSGVCIRVIEDAAYRELRYSGADLPGARKFDEDGATVISAGTFSKSFSPGIRVGWGLLPRDLVTPICNQKGHIDFGSANFNQQIMTQVMELGLLAPQIARLRAIYSQKLAAMLAAADRCLAPISGVRYRRPEGGLYVWAEMPQHVDTGPEGNLFDIAVEEGMLYVPGRYCFPREGERPAANAMRLSFGVQSPSRIDEGIAALSRAIARVERRE